jgi:hypothetical protein
VPFTPLTSEQIAQAVEGAIHEGADASVTIRRRLRTSAERRWLGEVALRLNEMLANPRFAFRAVETLASVFDDEPPFTLTRGILKRLPEVRRSTLEKNAWIKEDNWEWVIDEQGRKRVARGDNNRYLLQEGVPEGRI